MCGIKKFYHLSKDVFYGLAVSKKYTLTVHFNLPQVESHSCIQTCTSYYKVPTCAVNVCGQSRES